MFDSLAQAGLVPDVPVLPKWFQGPSYEDIEKLRDRSLGGLFLPREV